MKTPNFPNGNRQWLCLQCGYNMIGEMPDVCPFCGASHDRFRAWEDVETLYRRHQLSRQRYRQSITFYIYRDVLFICDYVFLTETGLRSNAYGPKSKTRTRVRCLCGIVKDKSLQTVCGYTYIADFADWMLGFERLVLPR